MKHAPRIHRTLALLIVMLLLAPGLQPPCRAEEPSISVDAEVLAVSKYIWRGLEVNEEFVLQPSVTMAYGGFSFNVWGNMDLTDFGESECIYTSGCDDRAGQFTEIDLTLDYTHSWDRFTLGVGIIAYEFPNWEGSEDTHELYVTVGYDTLLQPSLTVYYDFDEIEGMYATFGIGHSFAVSEKVGLDLSASVGFADSDYNLAYFGVADGSLVDFTVGIGMPIQITEMISVTPVLSLTTLVDSDLRDAVEEASCCDDETNIYGGVAVALSF
ncbi:MAG: hypothetical protein JW781_03040 [Deltaproteobacteria bacterium]|nr:hypothetical protein [Candidatus Anaeroferrophillacea bacterium]